MAREAEEWSRETCLDALSYGQAFGAARAGRGDLSSTIRLCDHARHSLNTKTQRVAKTQDSLYYLQILVPS